MLQSFRNGRSYAGELHFVYRNPVTGQMAVLGIFMESLSADSTTQNATINAYDQQTRDEWRRFIDVAENLRYENDSVVAPFNLAELIGENLRDFWRYEGSLTTPPCTEGIIWTLFKDRIIFSESEFASLRKNIYFEDYRRPQSMNTRTVYRNFLNESLSSILDYNCCPNKDRTATVAPIDKPSSVTRSASSKVLIVLLLFILKKCSSSLA